MPPSELKRPRLSFSCRACRRRKVRCGRERPRCNNCTRLGEVCVYETAAHELPTSRAQSPAVTERKKLPVRRRPRSDPLPRDGDFGGHHVDDHGAPIFARFAKSESSTIGSPLAASFRTFRGTSSPERPHFSSAWDEAVSAAVRSYGSERAGLLKPKEESPYPFSAPKLSSGGVSLPDVVSMEKDGVRYHGHAFWAYIDGARCTEPRHISHRICEQEREDAPRPAPLPSSQRVDPPSPCLQKPECDALMQSFLVSVLPLCPLVHLPTLLGQYEDYWRWSSAFTLGPEDVDRDRTFRCLILAALYAGASVASSSTWTSPALQAWPRDPTIERLQNAYINTLSASQHLRRPTLETIISSLIARPFLAPDAEPLENAIFVSTTARLAESIGLHRDETSTRFNPAVREQRRRVWWRLVWLDVQASIQSGLPPSCRADGVERVSMASETWDGDTVRGGIPPGGPSSTVNSGPSVAALYAIARYETARLQHAIVTHMHTYQRMTIDAFREFTRATERLHARLDALLAQVPTQGIPEKGCVPYRLAHASPMTDPGLYQCHASQPTVLGAWVRIMMTTLKWDVVVLLQKPLLPELIANDTPDGKEWKKIARLSTDYLRNFLQLCQVPAFHPFRWFLSNHHSPLQYAFLLMVYLRHDRESEDAQVARYLVDELIAQFDPSTCSRSNSVRDIIRSPNPVTKQILLHLRDQLNGKPVNNTSTSTSMAPDRGTTALVASAAAGDWDASLDLPPVAAPVATTFPEPSLSDPHGADGSFDPSTLCDLCELVGGPAALDPTAGDNWCWGLTV